MKIFVLNIILFFDFVLIQLGQSGMVFGSSRSYSKVSVRGFFKRMASNSVLTLTLFKYLYTLRQGWARVPGFAFPRSCGPGILEPRERKFFTGMQEQGTQRTRNANFAFLNFYK